MEVVIPCFVISELLTMIMCLHGDAQCPVVTQTKVTTGARVGEIQRANAQGDRRARWTFQSMRTAAACRAQAWEKTLQQRRQPWRSRDNGARSPTVSRRAVQRWGRPCRRGPGKSARGRRTGGCAQPPALPRAGHTVAFVHGWLMMMVVLATLPWWRRV
jgi:hypothetical protein